MKVSESWLREWVNPSINTPDLMEQLTMAGLEVDGIEPAAGEFSGVVVGEIISIEQHPDADKLRVCQVAGHPDGIQQVVCGAPNARAGIKIPFAMVGSLLPPGEDGKPFKIKKAKLRGVESHGMLCAQAELQVGEDDDGIWELPQDADTGVNLRDYLNLADNIIEIDLTPNRGDCLSIKGVARDVGVLNRETVSEPEIPAVTASSAETFPVEISAGAQCPRYVGRVIKGITLGASSPQWLQEKLRRAGNRSIDPVVDVTNYVLLELGQPMHAFDLGTLRQGINVRMAEQGEALTLLDGQTVELRADTLVIADAERAIAMAGIMGGQDTAVSDNTQDIFLESAFFDPIAIAGRARNYGLHTDSSHRFERGVDYKLQEVAIERATALLLEIVGGEAGPLVVVESSEHVPAERTVTLRRERINKGLGFAMEDAEVVDILTRLGLGLSETLDTGWIFTIPSYRFDISIEEDLLEELARVYGYNNLPTTSLNADLTLLPREEAKLGLPAVRQQLVARGYQEAIAYSFVAPELHKLFDPSTQPVELMNPISADMAVMRTTLWPGLVTALQHNLNRQQSRVRLFETGQRFVPSDSGLSQEPVIAGLIYGDRDAESWAAAPGKVDFFDIKGDFESVVCLMGEDGDISYEKGEHDALHPGQCAAVLKNGKIVGYLGALHPQIQKELGLGQSVYLFEVVQSAILQASIPAFSELSRFPEVRRDLALLVDRDIPAQNLLKCAKNTAGDSLRELKVFDVYQGEGIDPHRKSVALGLTFQHPSRTLTEDEINASVNAVITQLETEFNATQR